MPARNIASRRVVVLACSLAVAAGAAACGHERRVPRIDPDLHNWQEPYAGVAGLRLHVFNTGSMAMLEGSVFRGGNWFERRHLDVPAFVVELPGSDLVVFDTGLSERIREDRIRYMGILFSALNRVDMPAGAELTEQMKAAGLDPVRVRHVVLSHLHFDHTGSMRGFPNATVVTGRGEKDDAMAASGLLDAFRESDWQGSRWIEVDYSVGRPYATFSSHHDLLGDGAVVLVDLHGHTRGSQGMVLRAPNGPILLTGDAAWVDESWLYAGTPVWADDMDAWWEQIWRIKKFAQVVPQLLVVVGHDVSRASRQTRADLVIHEAPPKG